MGDPRKLKPKYRGPSHPWQKVRIDEEKILKKEYGLKNKTEIWRHTSKLKNFAKQAKRLVALHTAQAEKEKRQLLERLQKLGLISMGASTEAVLGLTIKDILERRLQTLVYRKGLANTTGQARQYITHGHIMVAGKQVNSPGHLVKTDDEQTISFVEASALANPEHPERQIKKKEEKPAEKTEEKQAAKSKAKREKKRPQRAKIQEKKKERSKE